MRGSGLGGGVDTSAPFLPSLPHGGGVLAWHQHDGSGQGGRRTGAAAMAPTPPSLPFPAAAASQRGVSGGPAWRGRGGGAASTERGRPCHGSADGVRWGRWALGSLGIFFIFSVLTGEVEKFTVLATQVNTSGGTGAPLL
ncbi:hypothetical protein U9M48_029248 [Paspalum notatum var. saurae]|uniref:Uncharacterized protein n=1 Tax=Paspalum notatum var. saurae TaxID=547442 RepID=A0AAQ3TYG3_PASNO